MKALTIALLCLSAPAAFAQEYSRQIKNEVVNISVNVADDSVRCSIIGYSSFELKIDVPALDHVATFNHRSLGEGKPCMTSIKCRLDSESREVADLLAGGVGPREVPLTVIHTERAEIDGENCWRWTEEKLQMEVNGMNFHHQRKGFHVKSTAESCKKIFAAK